jgi:ribose transport system substrate-binding protein
VKALRTRKLFSLAIATLVVAGATVASVANGGAPRSSAGDPPKKILVFNYFPRAFNDGTLAWTNGYQQGAATLGPRFDVIVKGEGQLDFDPGHYINFIKTGMVENPDGVIVVPNNSGGMTAGLMELKSQYPDAKWLIMDTPVPPTFKPISFVGTDNVAAGALAGKWLLGEYRKHKLVSNEVAIFRSPPGTLSQDKRVAGFLAAIKNSPLKVVKQVVSPTLDRATARSNMADVLTGHPELGGVFSATDNFGLGVADQLVAAKKLGVETVSIDAGRPAIEAILGHKGINADVAQHFYKMGVLAVLTLGHALDGKTVPKNIDTGTTLITGSNARSYLTKVAQESKP